MPALVAKARGADEGRVAVGRAVQHLVERARDMASARRAAPSSTPIAKRSAIVAASASASPISVTRLALPQRSPSPFSVPWIWRTPASHRGQRIGDGAAAIVMGVDAEMIARDHASTTSATMRRDLVGQRAAIGVAEHDPARAGLVGRPGAGQRVVRVGLVAVEEVLAVEHDLAARRPSRPRRFRGCRRGCPRARSRARHGHDSPRPWRRRRWRRPSPPAARRCRDRWRPSARPAWSCRRRRISRASVGFSAKKAVSSGLAPG